MDIMPENNSARIHGAPQTQARTGHQLASGRIGRLFVRVLRNPLRGPRDGTEHTVLRIVEAVSNTEGKTR